MSLWRNSFILLALMVGAGAGALALKPTSRMADEGSKIDLERMVPAAFGDWRTDLNQPVQVVNPQQTEVLSRIYSQTLSRSYLSPNGYRVMLSIAYGSDQSDTKQVHKPEVCYPAQGFSLRENRVGVLATRFGDIPVRRLLTTLGRRQEPVTYWITVGDRAIVTRGVNKKLAEMSYGFRGKIPDGLLFRVSSIDTDDKAAFAIQAGFVNQLLESLGPESRQRLGGLGSATQ